MSCGARWLARSSGLRIAITRLPASASTLWSTAGRRSSRDASGRRTSRSPSISRVSTSWRSLCAEPGHNPGRALRPRGGLVIDLSRMRGVEVDGAARIACAEGGATWLDFDEETQVFGLVTPGGIVGSTGVCRTHARWWDRPLDRAARPDVRQPGPSRACHTGWHSCSRERGREPGAPLGATRRGGNFGVATRLEFRLHPLETRRRREASLSAATASRDALRRFRDVVSELST